MKKRVVDLDELWELIDLPDGNSLLASDYEFAGLFGLQPGNDTYDEFNQLLCTLDDKTSLTIYAFHADGRLYTYLAVKDSHRLKLPQLSLKCKKYSEALGQFLSGQEARMIERTGKYPALLGHRIHDEPLNCYFGYVFNTYINDIELFVKDKLLEIHPEGNIVLRAGENRTATDESVEAFRKESFFLILVMHAPYGSADFWRRFWDFPADFGLTISISRIDHKHAEELSNQSRILYHALHSSEIPPPVARCYRYAVTLSFPCEHYEGLRPFLRHLRSLGCNPQVQSIQAEEALMNILPPGRPHGDCATDHPEWLFPVPGVSTVQRVTPAAPVSQQCASPTFVVKRPGGLLSRSWPLVAYDKDSGTLISEKHIFSRFYRFDNFYDPDWDDAPEEEFQRMFNTIVDTPVTISAYLQRLPVRTSPATNPMMRTQLEFLRANNIAFETRLIIGLHYHHKDNAVGGSRNMTSEQARKEIEHRLEEADGHLRVAEHAFREFTMNPLKGDEILSFLNPLLYSEVSSMDYYLQDPLAVGYLSEFLIDSDMLAHGSYLHFNGRYWGAFILTDIPPELYDDIWKRILTDYPREFTAVLQCRALTTAEQTSTLSWKLRQAMSTSTDMFGLPDAEAHVQAQDAQEAKARSYREGMKIFDVQVVVLQSADSLKILQLEQNELQTHFSRYGFKPLRSSQVTWDFFLSSLPPGRIVPSFRRRPMSDIVSALFPARITHADQRIHLGDMVYVDRTGTVDSCIVFDGQKLTGRPNNHIGVFGASGQGKTLAVEYMVDCFNSRYPGESSVTILDFNVDEKAGSYREMMKKNKGDYVVLNYDTPKGFDLFEGLRKDPNKKGELNLVAYMLQEMSRDPKKRLQGAPSITHPASKYYRWLKGFLSNVSRPQDVTLDHFIRRLNMKFLFPEWYGRLRNFFFSDATVDFDNPMLAFDFQKVGEDPYLGGIIGSYVMQRTLLDSERSNRFRVKYMIADELGTIVEEPMIVRFTEKASRAGRKGNWALVLASQDIGDLADKENGRVMLNNCSEVLLFKSSYHQAMENYGLSRAFWNSLKVHSRAGIYSEFYRVTTGNVCQLFLPDEYFEARNTDFESRYQTHVEEPVLDIEHEDLEEVSA